jgi:hypothetical protein
MALRVLLGYLLNLVVGYASILLVLFLSIFVFLFDLFNDFSFATTDSIFYMVGAALGMLLPFFGLNILFTKVINRKMKSQSYEKNLVILVNILYWFGAALFFFFPVVYSFSKSLSQVS